MKFISGVVHAVKRGFNACVDAGKRVAAAVVGGVTGLFGLSLSEPASAAPVDLTALTTAVDFSTATAAVLTIAGVLIGVYIAIKATKFVINMVKSG